MKKSSKKKISKIIDRARVYIKSSFNNAVLTATDNDGNVFAWATSGGAGFKGAKKSTPYAASVAAKVLIDKMKGHSTQEVEIIVSGISAGRDAAVRAFITSGFKIASIKDATPIPHNGCRPKKVRRV